MLNESGGTEPEEAGRDVAKHFIADSYDTEGGWMGDITVMPGLVHPLTTFRCSR